MKARGAAVDAASAVRKPGGVGQDAQDVQKPRMIGLPHAHELR